MNHRRCQYKMLILIYKKIAGPGLPGLPAPFPGK